MPITIVIEPAPRVNAQFTLYLIRNGRWSPTSLCMISVAQRDLLRMHYALPTSMARPGRNVCLRASRRNLRALSTSRDSRPVLTCGKVIRCDSQRFFRYVQRIATMVDVYWNVWVYRAGWTVYAKDK